MKNFTYNVNTYCENEEFTFRTNSITHALAEFFENVAEGYHTNIVNGFTGEVLAICGDPEGEDFATDEMALMMLGHLCAEAWGEEDDEEEDEPVCQMCGGDINENGVCRWCGAVYGAEPVPAEGAIADPLIAMLDDLVAQGKAVKLGGLPS